VDTKTTLGPGESSLSLQANISRFADFFFYIAYKIRGLKGLLLQSGVPLALLLSLSYVPHTPSAFLYRLQSIPAAQSCSVLKQVQTSASAALLHGGDQPQDPTNTHRIWHRDKLPTLQLCHC